MEMSESQINKLIKKLTDEDYDVRKNVEDVLIDLDSKSIPTLINALDNGDPGIQIQSARILGKIGNKKAINPLIDSLNNGNPDFRREVSLAIKKIVDKNPE
ncbi:MAG: HEAT repeat domain-containing protein [Methanobacterium sp.]|nr:HEAT repeat domain-containing protein [Methanobacterium sp.]